MDMMTSKRYTDYALYRRLFMQGRPYWVHLVGIYVLSLLSVPLALLLPLPLKVAVDSVIGGHPIPSFLRLVLPPIASQSDTPMLLLAAGLMVAICLLVYFQAVASWLLQTYTGEKLLLGFRAQHFAHVQPLSLAYHDSRGTTDSASCIQYDAPAGPLSTRVTRFLTSALLSPVAWDGAGHGPTPMANGAGDSGGGAGPLSVQTVLEPAPSDPLVAGQGLRKFRRVRRFSGARTVRRGAG